jgi:hypothetical protein
LYSGHKGIYYYILSIYWYIPLVKFVLGAGHKQVEEGNQPPSVTWEKFMPQIFFHCLAILDTPYKVILVQEHVPRCIQLLRNMRHVAVFALSAMSVCQLVVWTPACCT